MGVAVQFNYDVWAARYPEFVPQVDDALAALYFAEATLYHRNDGAGPVEDAAQQLALLNMVTAHIAALNAPSPDGSPPVTLVGRISSAAQGSVNVQTEYGELSKSQAFWVQTKYGAAYWQATNAFRRMRYLPHRHRFFNFPFR